MNSMRTRIIVTALVVGLIVPVGTASARPLVSGHGAPQASEQNDSGAIVLRRDGSEAAPFVSDVASDQVLVARATPVASEPSASGNGFDWGDAAIGAGAGLLTALVLAGGSAALPDRRREAAA